MTDELKKAKEDKIKELEKEKESYSKLNDSQLDSYSKNQYISDTYGVPNAEIFGYESTANDQDYDEVYKIRLKAKLDLDNMKEMDKLRAKEKEGVLILPGTPVKRDFEDVKNLKHGDRVYRFMNFQLILHHIDQNTIYL